MFATSNARILLPEIGFFTPDEIRQAIGSRGVDTRRPIAQIAPMDFEDADPKAASAWDIARPAMIAVAIIGFSVFMLAHAFPPDQHDLRRATGQEAHAPNGPRVSTPN